MTYVVTEACIRCKYTDCVDVCPTDAFREGPDFDERATAKDKRGELVRGWQLHTRESSP